MARAMYLIVGVDFDNTIADYDEVIHRVAVQRGLVPPDTPKSKRLIRDQVRRLPGGEHRWQEVQAEVYGPSMGEARLSEGVEAFFRSCRRRGGRVYVVSHKTEYARLDTTRTNLHRVALDWMRSKGFFDIDGAGLSEGGVYFEATRVEKIGRIRRLGCTHFVDDLEETFAEPSFPADVVKMLFAPHGEASGLDGVQVCATWEEIGHYVLGLCSGLP